MDIVETDGTIIVNTSITEETTVWISPSTLIGDIGDSFAVDIVVDPAEAIAGIQTDIQFDPTFLTATSVTDGGMFNMWYPPQLHIDNANGEIRNITAFETSGSVSTEGVLATLHFTAKMLSGTSNIDFINVIVGNPEGEVVPVTLMPGEVALYGDTFPPVSSVNTITPYSYHIGEMPLPLTASASDIGSGVKEVSLYYRYSTDNTTWTDWIEYGTKMSSSYTWFFTAPHGPGYYEFYSQATDNADNMEAEPLGADAFCRIYPEWDMNMDERVNILDIIIIGQQWGKTGSPGWILMDANSDGVVNILDLILVSQHWTG